MSRIVDSTTEIRFIPSEEPRDYRPSAAASLHPLLVPVSVHVLAAAAVAAERKHSHFRGPVSSSVGHSHLEPDHATHEFGTDLGLARFREGVHLNLETRADWFDRGG